MKKLDSSITVENIEKTIICFLLRSFELREKILPKIKEEDFSIEKNKFIFKKIKQLISTNKKTLDLNVLASKLELDNELKKVGGLFYLTEIKDIYVPTIMVEKYLEALINFSTKRKIIKELEELKKQSNKDFNYKDIISSLYERLNSIEDFFDRNFESFISLTEVVENFFENSENYNVLKLQTGFKTGFLELDKKLNGFQKGNLIILAARPSMGKTTLAINMIVPYIEQNNEKGDVIFFSLEMSPEQLAKKIIRLRTSFFEFVSSQERKNMPKELFLNFLKKKRVFFDKSSNINVSQIGHKLREWKKKSKISLVIIDYLQLLQSIKEHKNFINRNIEVSTWTRILKEISREIDAPILCLSQLSRSVEKREDKHPILSDLRDSGSIEQDADVVMFLYRDKYYNKENINDFSPHKAEIYIAKHRNGPIGKIDIMFFPKKQEFISLSKTSDE